MMGTRAAAFAGKIFNLRESLMRIQNGTMPQPTCIDLANMLKYFCQVLHDFRDFKDIENIPLYASEKRDQIQLIKTLPNFDYCGLYKTLAQLVDILPLIPQPSNGFDQLGTNLLMLFKCLVPFLDQANMETMPYLVTTMFMSLPQSFHKDILDTLCFNLLPFTIDQQQKNTAAMLRKAKSRQEQHKRFRDSKHDQKEITSRPVHCIVRIEDPNETALTHQSSTQDQQQDITRIDRDNNLEDQGIGMETDQQGEGYGGDELSSDEDEYALLSVTSILMISFHYIQEPMHHSQLVECLMKLKNNVFEDLLFVIAYGTTRARCPATEILFRYWPDICPSQQDRKNNSQASSKLKHIPWRPTKCQNKNCSFTTLEDDEAVKMCLDFKISITLSGLPPPMLICLDCVDSIYKQQLASGCLGGASSESIQALDDYSSKFIDLLLPMERVSKLCENKKCKSTDRMAIGTCFDIECANYNGKKPIRYCKTCFLSIHEPCEANNYDVTLQNHIRHSSIKLTILDNEENVNNFVEAIISLLKEAAPADRPSKDSERYLRSLMGPMSQFSSDNKDMNIATEEKQLISQYGIWLMTGLCKTVDRLSDELLGRLLGMLFQWFHFTACLPDDQAGSALEKLKGECIKGWIMGVKNKRLDVFISCLLPHPIDCSKIGGHWEVWPDTAHQIKEGFKRLLCLVPYDIITDDVWDEIMPYWMECFRHEVPENELSELKILLSKVFDPELSPLGFETKQMYNFISSRFEDSTNTNQEQTLYWLQIITMLEIPIPIDFLFQMLRSGVKSLAEIRSNELCRLKIASRLSDLNTRQSSEQQFPLSSSSSDASSSRSSSPASADTISVAEDDVLLPAAKESSSRPLSQQERQAQARAAFSAKLLQHASMLDAQHGKQTQQQLQSQSLSAISTATASIATTGTNYPSQPAGDGQPLCSSQPPLTKGQTSSILAAPVVGSSSNHSQPLKSTTSSISSAGQAIKTPRHRSKEPVRDKSAKGGPKDSARGSNQQQSSSSSDRPKLRLNLDSVDECSGMSKIDNNLICYILMVDILLKQLDLQEINSHRGLDGKEAQQAIELLNSIISTPWIGRHTCCDSLPYTGVSSPTTTVSPSNTFSAPSSAGHQQASKKSHQSKQQTDSANKCQQHYQHSFPIGGIHSFGHCAQGFEHEDSYETCVFCEIISTFHQLAMSLIEFFSPIIEVSICEVSQDAANGEFDGKPDYTRIGLDHLGPLQDKDVKFNFNLEHTLQRLQQQQDPSSPFSPSYLGPTLKPEVLNSLPKELQLAYNLLVQFHQYQTPDIVSQLLQMIKLISLHSQVLSKSAKNNPQFITWCQHNMLVNKLWSLCQLESSEIARTCVPLLLHCITLPWGVRLFRDLVERDFNSENWLSRFRAVERVVTIAYFCEPSTIKNSTLLQSTMASAFCHVVRCLDDIEAIVAQRALVSLEMMKTSSLKLLLWCLEVQFDYIIIDRPMILRSVFQLYNHLRDRRFLTWDFFLNRFDTIFLEAQIYLQQTGEIPSFTMQDLKNTNTKSEIYQKKIIRAKEALQETHHSRSLSSRFNEKKFTTPTSSSGGGKQIDELAQQYKQSVKLQQKMQRQTSGPTTFGPSDHLSPTTTSHLSPSMTQDKSEFKDKLLQDKWHNLSPMKRILQHGKSTSSRYQSVAYLTSQSLAKRKNSKFMSNLAMQSVPPLMSLPDKLHQHLPNSFVDDGSKLNEIAQENHVFGVVHRVCDEDRDTNHSLIFLLMQFFSKPDPSHPQSVKTLNRSHQIVLRHLNILMGYSVARKNFLIPAANLRLLPVFNAFLTSLPKVLDFNYTLGTILIDTCLPVLIYCPAPDYIQYDTIRAPNYSLWLLNPLMRQSWLMSVMTFLYKYQFGQQHLKDQVYMLMWIVINTLESHLNFSALDMVPVDTRCHILNVPTSQVPGAASTSSPASQVHEATGSIDDHGSVQRASNQQQDSATVVIESSDRQESPSKVEQIEMTQAAKAQGDKHKSTSGQMVIAPSASSSSLKHAGQALQTTGFSSSRPQIVKADTSDNLNAKTKLFQRHQPDTTKDVSKPGRIASSSSSTTCINMETLESMSSSVKQHTSEQHVGNEERLLPIGLQPGSVHQRVRQTIEPSHVERLLPIGQYSQVSSGTMAAGGKQASERSQQMGASVYAGPQDVRRQECAAAKMHGLTFKASSQELPPTLCEMRPLLGLKGNLAQSLIHPGRPLSVSSNEQSATILKTPPGTMATPAVTPVAPKSMPQCKDETSTTTDFSSPPGPSTSKGNRAGRFGATGKQSCSDGKQQLARELQQQQLADSSDATGTSSVKSTIGTFVSGRKAKMNKYPGKDYMPKQVNQMQLSFSSPSLLNEQLAHLNRHSFVQEFSDKDLSMCLVILETFIHHEPSMAAQLLPNILRLVARYSSSSLDSWQTGSNIHLVGGSMFVARQFIRVALHDLMENNIFHQIFTSHFTGYEFYKSMATALADFTDLNQLAPLSKLFEDLNKQKNLPPASSLMTILENVATYFECIISESTTHSQTTWNNFIMNWENFLRKLILALPRYSGTTIVAPTSSSNVGVRLDGLVPTSSAGLVGSSNQPTSGQSGGGTSGALGVVSNSANVFLSSSSKLGTASGQDSINLAPTSSGAIPSSCSMIMAPIMRIILSTTKISHLSSCKTIVDPYSKIISYTVLNSQFKYEHLLEINHNCCRLYTRDREKYLIQRTIAYELVQVLKFRFFILEENLLILLLFVLQDVGGTLAPKVISDNLKIDRATLNQADSYITNVSECLRQHIGDLLEFITDVHAISRINDNLIGSRPSSINRDSFGGHVKVAISQYLALEISLTNSGDNRTILRYLPWLYNSPSLQQGPREFIDCVSHIRQLSWIILGSLQHSALMRDCNSGGSAYHPTGVPMASNQHLSSSYINCQPIPIDKNSNVAEHVQVILAGFAEQSKESVLHMSGLFHAFLLCQLWTMYCENTCAQHPTNSEQYRFCQSTLDDFWSKITPGVLRLVGHSRVMSEMVSTHFLQLIESLIESNSSILIKYLPLWNSVFYSYKKRNKSGNLAIRLQKCIEWQPPDLNEPDVEQSKKRFINWLEKVQYKMSHIEIQSSQAAPFYLS